MTTLEIYTIQLGKWRLAKEHQIKIVNITGQSGISAFAPQMDWVMEYKAGVMSEEEYTRLYRAKMLTSQDLHPKFWDHFLNFQNVAVACYCPAGQFCHRLLFTEYLTDYLMKIHGVAPTMCGEIY